MRGTTWLGLLINLPWRTAVLGLAMAGGALASAGTPLPSAAQPQTEIRWPDEWPFLPGDEPPTGRGGAVSTTDPLATEVGRQVLEAGGTAVDAAVAVALALAVVNPEAGNLGGGGFMILREANGSTHALDFREKAPLRAKRDMYLDADGTLTEDSLVGHRAAGVPGTVMGLRVAHERFGTIPWADLVQPAVQLAEGFVMHARLASSLRHYQAGLTRFTTTRETFLPGGTAPAVGEFFAQPALAATLRRIRDEGAEGFYGGMTADLIVAEMERGGGIITHADLAGYTAVWREPLRFTYRGYTITSMPPPSSGGATMALMANLLEPHDLAGMGWGSPAAIHLFAEAGRRAYADRNQVLADPDFVPVPLATMTDKAYARTRGADITPDRATSSAQIVSAVPAGRTEGTETTHFSIVDQWGNAVAITTTINSAYGSLVTVAGAGFLLNNEMDDFAAKPGHPNQFGLVEGEQNAIAPGKRMLSSMSPTVVVDPAGELFFVTGTPGGSTIITTVLQTLLHVIDFGRSVDQAVLAPRVHHQHLPDQISWEPGGLAPEVVARLEAKGHRLVERPGFSGDVQAIMRLPDGTLTAFSDPRKGGTAVVLP
jgi:gamma-glutamyltranspeptidase/glutathione hydrolase